MPVKTTYTEAELKHYMETVLGDTADKLGWTAAGGDFDEPALEVLYDLDVDDLAGVTTRAGARKLRAVARMEAWRAAAMYTVHEASFSAGNPGTGTTNRGEIHRHAREMYEAARVELLTEYPDIIAGVSRTLTVVPVTYEGDYYADGS